MALMYDQQEQLRYEMEAENRWWHAVDDNRGYSDIYHYRTKRKNGAENE